MAMAGCTGPVLDEDDLAYTREVLSPLLDADDKRTVIECLFGDTAGATLGFTPRGLSPWAGLCCAMTRDRHRRFGKPFHSLHAHGPVNPIGTGAPRIRHIPHRSPPAAEAA